MSLNTAQKTKIITEKLGYPGRLLSASKSFYRDNHQNNIVFFNGNIYDLEGIKIWHGDVDITADLNKLKDIATTFGETIFVTTEQPFRWNEQSTEGLMKSCRDESKEYKNAYMIDP